MTEVSFARTFLSTLDSKPTKLGADHVEDPRSYPARAPYILPRTPRPFAPPATTAAATSAPGSEPSLTVTLKSLRNPPLDLALAGLAPDTSLLDVKRAVSARTGLPVDKVRLLHRKRPVADSKVLRELAGAGEGSVELGVMVLGGAATLAAAAGGGEKKDVGGETAGEAEGGEDKHVAVGAHGTGVLATQEFWDDLGGYLQQRLKDEKAAGEVLGRFRGAWEGR